MRIQRAAGVLLRIPGYDPRRNMAGRPVGVTLTDQLNQLGHTAHEKGGLAELPLQL